MLDWGLCVCARTARQATDTYTCILHRHIYMHVVQAHTHHTTPMTHPPRSPTLLQYEVQQHGLLRGAGKRTQALQPQQVAVQSKAEDNRTTGRCDNRRTRSQWVRVVHFNHGHTRARDRSHQTWATNTHDSRKNQSPQVRLSVQCTNAITDSAVFPQVPTCFFVGPPDESTRIEHHAGVARATRRRQYLAACRGVVRV